jgi:hypothetical protein
MLPRRGEHTHTTASLMVSLSLSTSITYLSSKIHAAYPLKETNVIGLRLEGLDVVENDNRSLPRLSGKPRQCRDSRLMRYVLFDAEFRQAGNVDLHVLRAPNEP